MKKMLVFLVSLLLAISTNCWAGDDEDFNQIKNNLETIFANIKVEQLDKVKDFIAPQAIFMFSDGIARDKANQLNLTKNIDMKNYKLSDFRFSRSGDVVVVTFKDEGVETINNKKLESGKQSRLAVFQKQGDKWLIIAYANFAKMK